VSRRLALLVATYRYQDVGLRQLAAPGHDAEALADVLRDPEIADFDVTVLVNEPHHVVGEAIGEFYHNRRRDDLTLLYFTGHGLKDDHGRLYFAMTNTKRDSLLFTGLSAQQIDDAMESCSSRQKVLVLDCCYSGAFPAGHVAKADSQVHTLEKFQGRGRVVLTASDATQYSFEGNHIVGQGARSVFTRFLVEGLTTGDADLDGDGDISLDELYSYVYDRVIDEVPQQRPKKQENVEGRIVIARNVHWRLPVHVRKAIESPFVGDRLAVFEGLAHLHRVGNDVVRAEVINQVRYLIDDDSQAVSSAAMKLITALDPERARKAAKRQVAASPPPPLSADDTTARNDRFDREPEVDRYSPIGSARSRRIAMASAILLVIGIIVSTLLSYPNRSPGSASGVSTPSAGISDPVVWVGAFCGGLADVIAGVDTLAKSQSTPQGQKDGLLAFSDSAQRAFANTAQKLTQLGPPRITGSKWVQDTAVGFFTTAAGTVADQRAKLVALDANDPDFVQKASHLTGPDLTVASAQTKELTSNKELEPAFRAAPECQRLSATSGSR
jgi:uncharacterized caspase-like protein